MNSCKYCNIELKHIDFNEAVCKECGLVYKIHRSLRTEKITKYIPCEWDNNGGN